MFARKALLLGVVVLGLLTASGCGNKNLGAFATVSGVVTHNGAPVEGARVAFHSTIEVAGKQPLAFAAVTDSSGKYLIASVGSDPGLPTGMYKVTVVKYEGGKGPEPQPGIDAGQMDAMASDGLGARKAGPVNLLPREYSTVGSTKLSATLESGKNQNVNFDLKGK